MLGASLLQLTQEETLEIRGTLQAITIHEKRQELLDREKKLVAMEAIIKVQQDKLIEKAKKVKKSTIEATRVAAQLRLMAGQLDRVADQILGQIGSST